MKAVLDANLFFSAWITDPLLTFAEEGFYEPIWSERILAEVKEHLPQVWSNASLEDTNRYVSMIQAAFPEAMTKNWQRYEHTVQLPDPDDRHVVAASIEAHADLIVTINIKDFPDTALLPHGIQTITPDKFLTKLFDEDPDESLILMRSLVSSKTRPPRTMYEEVLQLKRLGLSEFASRIQTFSHA